MGQADVHKHIIESMPTQDLGGINGHRKSFTFLSLNPGDENVFRWNPPTDPKTPTGSSNVPLSD